MATTAAQEKFKAFLRRTAGLTANQRLILQMYVNLATDRSGTVEMPGKELALLIGLAPPVFSRLRKQLIEDGWLEESGRPHGRIHYYRLAPKATGEQVVVPLRRTAT
jgi:DNA-binding MarR family transcriptional regulator